MTSDCPLHMFWGAAVTVGKVRQLRIVVDMVVWSWKDLWKTLDGVAPEKKGDNSAVFVKRYL